MSARFVVSSQPQRASASLSRTGSVVRPSAVVDACLVALLSNLQVAEPNGKGASIIMIVPLFQQPKCQHDGFEVVRCGRRRPATRSVGWTWVRYIWNALRLSGLEAQHHFNDGCSDPFALPLLRTRDTNCLTQHFTYSYTAPPYRLSIPTPNRLFTSDISLVICNTV
jgi:hypothetical protein